MKTVTIRLPGNLDPVTFQVESFTITETHVERGSYLEPHDYEICLMMDRLETYEDAWIDAFSRLPDPSKRFDPNR